MNVSAYFARIGLPGDFPISHTYEFLREVQYHHVTTVPYENLDILDGRPLSLRPEDLFDKIVTRHRGGYCFEVNGALSALLKELGFPVTNYFDCPRPSASGTGGHGGGRRISLRHRYRTVRTPLAREVGGRHRAASVRRDLPLPPGSLSRLGTMRSAQGTVA